MLRAIKSILLDRLEDLKEGKHWSNRLVEHQMDDALMQHFERSNVPLDGKLISTLKMYALNRFQRLWRCSSIQQLVNHKHKLWYIFERTDAEKIDKITLYCAPDLAIQIQSRWLLIRFDMQGEMENHNSELEATAMVLWSQRREGLPKSPERYTVRTVAWRRGFWEVHTYKPSIESVRNSLSLINFDVEAMKGTARRVQKNLAFAPLAWHQSTCRKCPFKVKCPGSKNLRIAKSQQALIELSFQENSRETRN